MKRRTFNSLIILALMPISAVYAAVVYNVSEADSAAVTIRQPLTIEEDSSNSLNFGAIVKPSIPGTSDEYRLDSNTLEMEKVNINSTGDSHVLDIIPRSLGKFNITGSTVQIKITGELVGCESGDVQLTDISSARRVVNLPNSPTSYYFTGNIAITDQAADGLHLCAYRVKVQYY